MTLSADDQKALEYLQREKKREAFQRFLQSRLKAPAEPALRQKRNWAPLRRSNV